MSHVTIITMNTMYSTNKEADNTSRNKRSNYMRAVGYGAPIAMLKRRTEENTEQA